MKKKKVYLSLLIILVAIIAVVWILTSRGVKFGVEPGVFYFKSEGADAKLFLMESNGDVKEIITLPAQKVDEFEYKAPQRAYLSNSGKEMIFFEKIEEVPIGEDFEEGVVYARIVYKPKYIRLEDGFEKEIEQDIDPASLVFSPDDKKIAWVLEVEGVTVEELEEKNKQREVWISNPDGKRAELVVTPEDKVVLLEGWVDDLIYFLGIQGGGYQSIGRINLKTNKVEYIVPRHCEEGLWGCAHIEFSPSGEEFIYEVYAQDDEGNVVTELYIESFDGEKSQKVLISESYISERTWLPNGRGILYTTQKKIKQEIKEEIHLVDISERKDEVVYLGSYVSQLITDKTAKYLYFIEKENEEKFNIVRLNIKEKKAEIIDSGPYYHLRLLSSH